MREISVRIRSGVRTVGVRKGKKMSGVSWGKSSYSTHNGQCVKVGGFRKSSYSYANGGCIEVAPGVYVRDTKEEKLDYPTTLHFNNAAWHVFIERVKTTMFRQEEEYR